MKPTAENAEIDAVARAFPSMNGSHRRTLDALFHHPSAQNLEWNDVVSLFSAIGHVQEKSDNKFVFAVAGKRHVLHKPHTKDLASSETLDLRHFLVQAGISAEHPTLPVAQTDAAPSLLIVVDHHGAKIFRVDLTSANPSEHVIRPYDPHHFLHHLVHKDQSRERGQRAPEEPAYYARIAEAMASGGKIVLVGHGVGTSNAAHHLADYLHAHAPETYRRVVLETVADLSGITTPQLLDLARQALRA